MIASLLTRVTVRRHESARPLASRHRFGTTQKVLFIGPLLAVIALLALVPRWHSASVLAAGQQRSFDDLGPMPGSCQGCDTYGSGLSADPTVIGEAYVCPDGSTTCTSTGKLEVYRWTVAGGYQLLGGLSVAAKKGASLAGEKGPGIWLRYGRTWGS
jgi:hypothetical protein